MSIRALVRHELRIVEGNVCLQTSCRFDNENHTHSMKLPDSVTSVSLLDLMTINRRSLAIYVGQQIVGVDES